MVSLNAVAKRAQQILPTTQETETLLKKLAEYAWHELLKKTGTSLTSREIKLLPQKDFFENMMGKLIGANSIVSIFSFFRKWGNRLWLKTFGTQIRPAHACLFVCLSLCVVLTLYFLPTRQFEKSELIQPTNAPHIQQIYKQVRGNLTEPWVQIVPKIGHYVSLLQFFEIFCKGNIIAVETDI